MTENYDIFMNRCFQLAQLGEGLVEPNPKVGSILVFENKIISEGYHQKFGEAHAEVNCINSCLEIYRDKIAHATLYVSLEPCSHFGKTGPCSHLIVQKGIKKVVVGSRDFNPLVNGNGIHYLKENGVEVLELNWDEKQKELNPQFYVNQVFKRPFIIAKYAESADGFISKFNKSIKITPNSVDALSHKLRSQVDAILIGKNTFKIDEPQLNVRLVEGKNPDRIVLDSNLENDYNSWSSDSQKSIILNHKKESNFQSLYYTKIIDSKDCLSVLNRLYEMGYYSILIEGGNAVLERFFNSKCVDRIIVYKNHQLQLEEGIKSPIWNLDEFKLLSNHFVESTEIKSYQSCNI